MNVSKSASLLAWKLILGICLPLIAACAGPRYPCTPGLSRECTLAQVRWQKAIDSVVAANFPADYGKFISMIWDDEFDNAWVSKGREVNITRQFAEKLTDPLLLCVAAHELAHLKMGHYYAREGIIIVDPSAAGGNEPFPRHYENMEHVAEGFGKNQEEEADRQALKYLRPLGIPPMLYLSLLHLFESKDNKEIPERIHYLRSRIISRTP